MISTLRFLPAWGGALLITLFLVEIPVDAQTVKPFSSLSIEEAKARLAEAEISAQRREMVEAAFASRRLDLVQACFEDFSTGRYFPDAVIALQDRKFAAQVVVMMLRCPSGNWLEGMTFKAESFQINMSRPYGAAIKHVFPDVEFKAEHLLHTQTRLFLADRLEAELKKTAAPDAPGAPLQPANTATSDTATSHALKSSGDPKNTHDKQMAVVLGQRRTDSCEKASEEFGRLLKDTNVVGAALPETRNRLGKPDAEDARSLSYIFTAGYGGWEWILKHDGSKITGFERRGLN